MFMVPLYFFISSSFDQLYDNITILIEFSLSVAEVDYMNQNINGVRILNTDYTVISTIVG